MEKLVLKTNKEIYEFEITRKKHLIISRFNNSTLVLAPHMAECFLSYVDELLIDSSDRILETIEDEEETEIEIERLGNNFYFNKEQVNIEFFEQLHKFLEHHYP